MRQHQRTNGERSPHKPLLLLYALGQLAAGRDAHPWVDAQEPLADLLDTYGPPNPIHPNYPFRRLANDDGLWVVTTRSAGPLPSDASGRQLRDADAIGRLSDEFVAALRADPALVVLIARYLLEDNWPSSLHDDIASAVGLDLDSAEASIVRGRLAEDLRRRRDATFRSRRRILIAYEYRWALCGYDGWLDRSAVGLEAAHIQWWSADGPDTVDNGLCVCSLHHVLFDSGVLGLSEDMRINVSKRFVARAPAGERLVLDLAGRDVRQPQAGDDRPALDRITWHATQVFRSPARLGA
jgi:putative restriction endonuclease